MKRKEIKRMLKEADTKFMAFAKIAGQPRNKVESKMLDSFVRSRMTMERALNFAAKPGKAANSEALAIVDNSYYINREKIIRDRYCTFLGMLYIGVAAVATAMLASVCLAILLS